LLLLLPVALLLPPALFPLFALWLLSFIDDTPAVFLLPLLFVTTAVFDETVLALVLAGMLALVSTTPFLLGEPVLFPFAVLVFPLFVVVVVVLSLPPQPAISIAAARTTGRAGFNRIRFFLRFFVLIKRWA